MHGCRYDVFWAKNESTGIQRDKPHTIVHRSAHDAMQGKRVRLPLNAPQQFQQARKIVAASTSMMNIRAGDTVRMNPLRIAEIGLQKSPMLIIPIDKCISLLSMKTYYIDR